VVQAFRLLTQAESLHHKRPLPQDLVRPSNWRFELGIEFILYILVTQRVPGGA